MYILFEVIYIYTSYNIIIPFMPEENNPLCIALVMEESCKSGWAVWLHIDFRFSTKS